VMVRGASRAVLMCWLCSKTWRGLLCAVFVSLHVILMLSCSCLMRGCLVCTHLLGSHTGQCLHGRRPHCCSCWGKSCHAAEAGPMAHWADCRKRDTSRLLCPGSGLRMGVLQALVAGSAAAASCSHQQANSGIPLPAAHRMMSQMKLSLRPRMPRSGNRCTRAAHRSQAGP
jgi:hypothetical protein